mgnify:CR=1 FL=1
MLNIGAGELTLILVVALLILGPSRLPELARGLGKFLREFRSRVKAALRRSAMARRTGLPRNTHCGPLKWRHVDSNETYAFFTTRPSQRLVSPGTAFCSISTVGTPETAADIVNGPAAYPPTATTRSG